MHSSVPHDHEMLLVRPACYLSQESEQIRACLSSCAGTREHSTFLQSRLGTAALKVGEIEYGTRFPLSKIQLVLMQLVMAERSAVILSPFQGKYCSGGLWYI